MWQALNILSAISDIYLKASKLYREWQERDKARAEVAETIAQEKKKINDATADIANRGLSDDDLNRRLQDGSF